MPAATDGPSFPNAVVPANRISAIAQKIQEVYPAPNTTADLNGNRIADDYVVQRAPMFDRHNYDAKVSFNRSTAHQIWGKVSYLKADVDDRFQLGFDQVAPAPTTVTAPVIGHTWTLSPTLILDGSFGVTYNEHVRSVARLRHQFRQRCLGDPRHQWSATSRGAAAAGPAGLSALGNNSTWNPYFYTTSVYSFSQALTKVAGRHELRVGYDFNHLEMNHWQPEIGSFGPRGGFTFGGNVTGAPRLSAGRRLQRLRLRS